MRQMWTNLPGYPQGVSQGQTSDRVKGMAVMLYLLAIRYGGVSLVLESLGVPLSKTAVYDAVQAVARRIPGMKREQVFADVKTKAVGGDLTSVKCAGKWLHLGISVDAIAGFALTIDAHSSRRCQDPLGVDGTDCHKCGS